MKKKMPKEASRRKPLNIRNIDSDLWDRITEHLSKTGQKKWAFVEQALREKYEREKA